MKEENCRSLEELVLFRDITPSDAWQELRQRWQASRTEKLYLYDLQNRALFDVGCNEKEFQVGFGCSVQEIIQQLGSSFWIIHFHSDNYFPIKKETAERCSALLTQIKKGEFNPEQLKKLSYSFIYHLKQDHFYSKTGEDNPVFSLFSVMPSLPDFEQSSLLFGLAYSDSIKRGSLIVMASEGYTELFFDFSARKINWYHLCNQYFRLRAGFVEDFNPEATKTLPQALSYFQKKADKLKEDTDGIVSLRYSGYDVLPLLK